MIKVRRLLNIRGFVIIIVLFAIYSCSTTKQIERNQTKQAYATLELTMDRKDNVLLYREAASWLNVPHRDGGISRSGIDCSSLVGSIYQKVYGIKLERNSQAIFDKNCRSISKHRLKEGDLVFFNTNNKKTGNKINHVGLYLKDNKFIHASSSKGVIVSNLDEVYYVRTWVCGGRVKQ